MSDLLARLSAALQDRYRIERQIGEGGMATVYLAEDLKHERPIALKVLRPALAAVLGGERFLAEIKTTANLQHPHILPLFDSGEADGFLFYAMPYVEGETLRDRLDREHQLPVADAVQITQDVSEALAYAHERGVIHRDIKPANILMQAGRPMLADFGIALAVGAAGGGRLTETGLSIGTPLYMSPEQATGEQYVGAAADVYSLGCVLYEMLVGNPPYTGSSAQVILGKIIASDPVSVTVARSSVPLNVDAAISRALEKVPADRFMGAEEFARALGDPGFRHGSAAVPGLGAGLRPWKRLSLVTSALTLVFAAGLGWALLRPAPPATSNPVVRFSIPIDGNAMGRKTGRELAFSPDGKTLVHQTNTDAGSRLTMRRLDQAEGRILEGAGEAALPFFSPDGDWIGFVDVAERPPTLKRISVADGTVQTIAGMRGGPGLTWGDDGSIVSGGFSSLLRVPATGGEWEVLAEPDSMSGERFGQPHMLPGSEVLLFHVARTLDPEKADIVALDLDRRTRKTILTNAMDPQYVPTGHLLFLRQGTLMTVPFDRERLEVTGEPLVVVEEVMQSLYHSNTPRETGAAQVVVSAAGHLAYVGGGVEPERQTIAVLLTSGGDTVRLNLDPRDYSNFRISPDGNSLGLIAHRGQQGEVLVYDLARGTTRLLNTGGFVNWPMEWSPDGRSIAVSTDRDGAHPNIYRVRADGGGEPERLAPMDRDQSMASWSPQGVIAFLVDERDIWVQPPDGEPTPFVASEASEVYATFSPNGQWLAYASNESGRSEVYVRPYPGPDPATLITSNGGTAPAWSSDGTKLYFTRRIGAGFGMMVVDVVPGEPFGVGQAVPFLPSLPNGSWPSRIYDVLPDGSVATSIQDPAASAEVEPVGTEVHVVLNWFEELRARVAN